MQKKSIKTITVKNLINFLLAASIVMMAIFAFSFRYITQMLIKNQAFSISEIVFAGLTSHMKANIMEKRSYFLEEIRSLKEVEKISIIRSSAVTEQYGRGYYELEKETDEIARKVFKNKAPVFIINDFSAEPKIRAVIPYIATKKGTLNCLVCHNVNENSVLGAIDIEIDLSEYQKMAMQILFLLMFFSFLFMFLIIINTFSTIERYIKEPLEHIILKAREAYSHRTPLIPEGFESMEFVNVAKEFNIFTSEIVQNQEELKKVNIELIKLNNEIEDTLRETVFTMGLLEEKRSKETKNHTRRVTLYCNLIAEKLGLSKREIDLITIASSLHDIGKIGISDSILLKPGQLSNEEFEIMKYHTEIGYRMLIHSKRDILLAAAVISHQHHEKWDGSGYPQGLSKEDIHLFGRIVALADVFDALVSDRVYKKSWDLDKIVQWMQKEREKHFDPEIVDVFIKNADKFLEIYEKNR